MGPQGDGREAWESTVLPHVTCGVPGMLAHTSVQFPSCLGQLASHCENDHAWNSRCTLSKTYRMKLRPAFKGSQANLRCEFRWHPWGNRNRSILQRSGREAEATEEGGDLIKQQEKTAEITGKESSELYPCVPDGGTLEWQNLHLPRLCGETDWISSASVCSVFQKVILTHSGFDPIFSISRYGTSVQARSPGVILEFTF